MAHESFENAETAAYMNEHFVCIKVDREERPDVDAVYMEATTAMTGQGGWPMTAFLTPAGEPFYCGTYFPPAPRYGIPSFGQLMSSVVEAWTSQREQVLEAGAHIVAQLAAQSGAASAAGELTPTLVGDAVALLAMGFDDVRGGFGSAPKFPPSMVLEWLLRHAARTGDARALHMVERTAVAMARGGLYDQLAGGFARYSTDASWIVPHFEKMLYDNALLLRVSGGRPATRRCATWPAGLPSTQPTSSYGSCVPRRAGSPQRWTPTPRASRASSTSGRRNS
jgi:uncharacterized protein YyaL (SSP411 family)